DWWELQYLGGTRIGYFHTEISQSDGMVRVHRKGVLSVGAKDSGAKLFVVDTRARELMNGELYDFDEKNTLDGEPVSSIAATRDDDKLKLDLAQGDGGNKSTQFLDWKPGTWGVLGLQSMLMHDPIEPGERRTCDILNSSWDAIITLEVTASEPQMTPLAESQRSLIPIEVVSRVGEQESASRHWVTEDGMIYKTVSLGAQRLSSFRVSEELGKSVADEMFAAEQWTASATYRGVLPTLTQKNATFQVESDGASELHKQFVEDSRQSLRSISPQLLEVSIADPRDIKPGGVPKQPESVYLESSFWMPADHGSIAALAGNMSSEIESLNSVTGVLALAKRFSTATETEEMQPTVTNALLTARHMRGDEKDQAILFATLLRQLKVPARLGFGIELQSTQQKLVLKVWTEAWTENRWIPIDVSSGSWLSVDCIKMFHAAFAERNPYVHFLRVLETLRPMTVSLQPER
ncbi:MAG: transglutaminase domain-containing protein, partial [Planctomycetota bacterium]